VAYGYTPGTLPVHRIGQSAIPSMTECGGEPQRSLDPLQFEFTRMARRPSAMSARLYPAILPARTSFRAAAFYGQLFAQPGFRVSPGRHSWALRRHASGLLRAACRRRWFESSINGEGVHYSAAAVHDLETTLCARRWPDARSWRPDAIETRMGGAHSTPETRSARPICFVDEKSTAAPASPDAAGGPAPPPARSGRFQRF
jgi:hypothetical protein